MAFWIRLGGQGICLVDEFDQRSPGAAALFDPITLRFYLRVCCGRARVLLLREAFAHFPTMRITIGAAVTDRLCSFFRNMTSNSCQWHLTQAATDGETPSNFGESAIQIKLLERNAFVWNSFVWNFLSRQYFKILQQRCCVRPSMSLRRLVFSAPGLLF